MRHNLKDLKANFHRYKRPSIPLKFQTATKKNLGRRALLRIPSTAGRSVCLCWAKSKPKGPKGTDLTPPHTQSLTLYLWDIHGWSSYTSTTGYHEPQNG